MLAKKTRRRLHLNFFFTADSLPKKVVQVYLVIEVRDVLLDGDVGGDVGVMIAVDVVAVRTSTRRVEARGAV